LALLESIDPEGFAEARQHEALQAPRPVVKHPGLHQRAQHLIEDNVVLFSRQRSYLRR
jgi:hypothetical protein